MVFRVFVTVCVLTAFLAVPISLVALFACMCWWFIKDSNDNVRQGEEHSQESLLQPILMTSLSSASNLPVPVRPAAASASTFANIGKSRSHFDKPLNTSTSRGHGGCARSRIGKRNDEPFLVKLYEEPQRLFMAKSEADILNGTLLTDGGRLLPSSAHCGIEH